MSTMNPPVCDRACWREIEITVERRIAHTNPSRARRALEAPSGSHASGSGQVAVQPVVVVTHWLNVMAAGAVTTQPPAQPVIATLTLRQPVLTPPAAEHGLYVKVLVVPAAPCDTPSRKNSKLQPVSAWPLEFVAEAVNVSTP